LIQSIDQFGVFRTEFVDQCIGLFADRFDRLAIMFLVSLLQLIVGFIQITIDLCFRFITGDGLDDVLNICLCWLRYAGRRTALLRVSKRRRCDKSGNGGDEP
jgi:hypothetical protein